MSTPICIRLSPEVYAALERLNKQSGEKTITHTVRRLIADGLNNNNTKIQMAELIDRLTRIESQTSILEKVDLS